MTLFEQASAIAYLTMGLFVGVAGGIVAWKQAKRKILRGRGRHLGGPDLRS